MTDVNQELLEALREAEIALLNCIPIVPYPGDGPLVKIRAAIKKAESLPAPPEVKRL